MDRDDHPDGTGPRVSPGPWLAVWLGLPVALSPVFCLLLALDAGALLGLDAAAAREVALALALDLYRLWLAATLVAAATIALAARRRRGAPSSGPASGCQNHENYETNLATCNALSRNDDRGFA